METNGNGEQGENLRNKAENLLKKVTPGPGSSFSEADMLKLRHELEVHRIELEIQNQELIVANEKAEAEAVKYSNLYDFAPSGYFTLSREGRILEVNLQGAILLGKTRSSILNRFLNVYVSENQKAVFVEFLNEAFETGQKKTCEIYLEPPGSAPLDVILTGIPDESRQSCFITMVDITDLKKARQALHVSDIKYQTLFHLLPTGITISDSDGRILETNLRGEEILGISSEEHAKRTIRGKEWRIIRSDGSEMPADEYASVRALQEQHQVDNVEMGVVDDAGQVRWINACAVPIPLVGFGVAITYTDVTEYKRIEKDLMEAKEKAEVSDRLKSAFLANMSHEIRTPMNGILGFTALLREPELPHELQDKYIGIIHKSGLRLLSIINDIIDISSIEAGLMPTEISETNINEKVDDVYNLLRLSAEQKGIGFSCSCPLPDEKVSIMTDGPKIAGILTNLVQNALKFTTSGTIEFGYEHMGSFLEFFVKDTGTGIQKDQQEMIFQRFMQGKIEKTRIHEGTGLGLAISRAFVEMLGGKIWLRSEPGSGTVFYFTIPYNPAPARESVEDSLLPLQTNENPPSGLTVLLVEDDDISVAFITHLLHGIGSSVIHVKTGTEAVETCRNHPDLDLVLMDIKIPGIDGHEATRRIRGFNKDIVIIAQTAYGLSGDREKALEAGCNAYLSKPIEIDILMSLIRRFFGVQ